MERWDPQSNFRAQILHNYGRKIWLASLGIAYEFNRCDTPIPLFNPDIEQQVEISPTLLHLSHTIAHDYLHPSFYIDSAPISHMSKHFWNSSTSYYKHLLSAPNLHPQILRTIQRYMLKMPCSCFSGLDVEISRALEFTQSNNNQHHGIFICSHIISLKPLTRALCFSFESKCNYSKELSHKRQFKNLSFSLARGHQNMGCCNFIDNQLAPDSHLLFATEKCSA